MLDNTCLAGIKMLVYLEMIILVTVALVDVTDDLHGVGHFPEEIKPLIQAAMGSRNLESSQSREESIL
uniref:Uncharacterized protein n=1 Tax=Arundo donax TaxID=35708 RepID=A0A0A9GCY0_ARUDO